MLPFGLKRDHLVHAALLVLAGLLCACSAKQAMQVGWEYDPGASFVGLRTYAWVPGAQQRTGDPRVDDIGVDRRIRRAIDKQLAAQRFVAVAPEKADFWVGYHLLLRNNVQTSTAHTAYGYNRPWGSGGDFDRGWRLSGAPTTYSRRYDVGTLTVFIEAPATQQPIWQGFAQAEIEPSDDMETRNQRLEKAAVSILEKFPPATTPATATPGG